MAVDAVVHLLQRFARCHALVGQLEAVAKAACLLRPPESLRKLSIKSFNVDEVLVVQRFRHLNSARWAERSFKEEWNASADDHLRIVAKSPCALANCSGAF